MSYVPKWGRSSTRRIRLIRWSRREIASITILGGCISALCLVLAQWLATHIFDRGMAREPDCLLQSSLQGDSTYRQPGRPSPYRINGPDPSA
jgi:cyanate permease